MFKVSIYMQCIANKSTKCCLQYYSTPFHSYINCNIIVLNFFHRRQGGKENLERKHTTHTLTWNDKSVNTCIPALIHANDWWMMKMMVNVLVSNLNTCYAIAIAVANAYRFENYFESKCAHAILHDIYLY